MEGTVEVPCYLDQPGCPAGSRFRLGPTGQPVRTPGNVTDANFICNIPRSVSSATPGRLSLYGHGLFGSAAEVNSISQLQIASEHRVVLCASDWIGMSGGDVPNTISILGDLSAFPELADRLQQGFLNFLFLGRAMIHPKGLSSSLAFRDSKGPLIDTRKLYYSGGSQGGIAGGALTAVAPDFTRSVLIVPGMNYSLLLTRSVDFDPFAQVLYPAYPDELIRPLLLSLIQTLWDRGEPGRLRLAHDDRPLPEHAGAHRAAPHGVRRPPGLQRRHRGRGADDRREASGCRRSTPAVTPTCIPTTGSSRSPGTRTAAARWSSGTSARCAATSGPRRRRSRTRRRGWAATRTGSPAARPAAQLQFSRFIDGEFIDVCG